MNLVSNASEAMTGGGDISIRTDNRYVDKAVVGYETIEKGEYVTLSVSDTGIGISKDDIGRVFEPFYTRKVMGRSGTGLGMAVVWGTIKDHGGYIDVQSKEGEGTTFTLYFPVTRRAIRIENSHISMDSYKGMEETILIVDDEEEQREIASDILEKLGYTVTIAPSGEEAVDFLKSKSVDLIVLDMIMEPGIDGLETFKRILEFRPEQRAIIASGFSETERIKAVQSLGAGQYIKKPYTLEKIGIAVREELDKRPPKA
jgi:CheY-like chemotaxis protein